MAIRFPQLRDTRETANSTKPVFRAFLTPHRLVNRFRIIATVVLILSVLFWGVAYYLYINHSPFSPYAKNITLSMVEGNSTRDAQKVTKSTFSGKLGVFASIQVEQASGFDAVIQFSDATNNRQVSLPIKISRFVQNETRFITFDAIRNGPGTYKTELKVNDTVLASTLFDILPQ